MNQISEKKVGLVFGAFIGLWHVVWSGLVLLGWAQPLINFILKLHMVTMPFQVGPFFFKRAVVLVVVTFFVGYIGGWVVGTIWNRVHKN